MENSPSTNEEWTVVKSKRTHSKPSTVTKAKGRKTNDSSHDKIAQFGYQQSGNKQLSREKTVLDYTKSIDKQLEKFKCSIYFNMIKESLQQSANLAELQEVTVLGIGSIADSVNSQWQLVWILSVFEYITTYLREEQSKSECRLSLFDPMLQPIDHQICQHYNITTITENNKGFANIIESVTNDHIKILYYMPHCPYRLYCNILWSHWEQLNAIAIIGNSFASYEVRRQSTHVEDVEKVTDSVTFLTPYVTETSLWSIADSKVVQSWEYKHQWESAFCDMTFIMIPNTALHMIQAIVKPDDETIRTATSMDKEVF